MITAKSTYRHKNTAPVWQSESTGRAGAVLLLVTAYAKQDVYGACSIFIRIVFTAAYRLHTGEGTSPSLIMRSNSENVTQRAAVVSPGCMVSCSTGTSLRAR